MDGLCPYRNVCVLSLQDEEECNKHIQNHFDTCKYYLAEREDYAHIIHQYECDRWRNPRRTL